MKISTSPLSDKLYDRQVVEFTLKLVVSYVTAFEKKSYHHRYSAAVSFPITSRDKDVFGNEWSEMFDNYKLNLPALRRAHSEKKCLPGPTEIPNATCRKYLHVRPRHIRRKIVCLEFTESTFHQYPRLNPDSLTNPRLKKKKKKRN